MWGVPLFKFMSDDESPIVTAIKTDYKYTKLLLKYDVKIGSDVLMDALSTENIEIMKLLLINGANLNTQVYGVYTIGERLLSDCYTSNKMKILIKSYYHKKS